jgi:hypothetical protein
MWWNVWLEEAKRQRQAVTRQNPPLTALARKESRGKARAETMDHFHVGGQLVDGLCGWPKLPQACR